MSHPSVHYIRALICEGRTDTDITEELEYKRFLPVQPQTLSAERRDIGTLLDPDEIRTSQGRQTIQWLRSRGVYTYFRHHFQLENPNRVLFTARVRELVETMLLASIPPKEISRVLQQEPGFELVSTKDIKLYKHYYWNPDLLTHAEMMACLSSKTGTGLYVDALRGGSDVLSVRMGLLKPVALDDTHTQIMQQLGLRMKMLDKSPYTKDTNQQAVALSSAYTRMWKNHKTVGADALQQAHERLRAFIETREKPRIQDSSVRSTLLTQFQEDDDDDDLETYESDE